MQRHRGTYPCGTPRPAGPTRRQFVQGIGTLVGAATVGCAGKPPAMITTGPTDAATHGKAATDRVTLGATGIVTSRLALGSGTHGANRSSDQVRMGMTAFVNQFTYGYSKGLTFFETADDYGAHPYIAEAVRQVGRQNVVVLTKTEAQTASAMKADLDRFRSDLGIDMIDIVLLHNKQSATWTTECAGAMDVLSQAKESGIIRAHGVSCHTLAALQLAAATPWVEIDQARVNPDGILMDADPATVIGVLTQMKASGKGVIGMKILGEGQLGNQVDRAIGHAVGLDCIDAFTIGFTSNAQMDEVVQKIATS
ncbi:MAG TPA: aldo/keto reductase [Polyangia bacterium]|jgi:aryl-alcohol dehydrogenase-like predicted oxidoreductase|nr:aldo/keto reductase [Polyangia bacterium]